jgi:hypothetical protein
VKGPETGPLLPPGLLVIVPLIVVAITPISIFMLVPPSPVFRLLIAT